MEDKEEIEVEVVKVEGNVTVESSYLRNILEKIDR